MKSSSSNTSKLTSYMPWIVLGGFVVCLIGLSVAYAISMINKDNSTTSPVAQDTKPDNKDKQDNKNPPPPPPESNILNAPTFTNAMTMNLSQTTFKDTFTFEAWIYGNFTDTGRRGIIGIEPSDKNNGFYIISEGYAPTVPVPQGNGAISPYTLHVGYSSTFGGHALRNNTWTHVAATRDSNNIVNLYYNGVASTNGPPKAWVGDCKIGNLLGNGFVGGKIMNVRVWNIARTQSQIDKYKTKTSLNNIDTTTGLIAWYPLQSDTKDLISNTSLTGGTMTFTSNTFDWTV